MSVMTMTNGKWVRLRFVRDVHNFGRPTEGKLNWKGGTVKERGGDFTTSGSGRNGTKKERWLGVRREFKQQYVSGLK